MILDGDGVFRSIGDGTIKGNCPDDPSGPAERMTSLRCLSSGECRICKFIKTSWNHGINDVDATVNRYEGCVITSSAPICDANKLTANAVEFDNAVMEGAYGEDLDPICAPCKQAGKGVSQMAPYFNNTKCVICTKNS